MKFYLIMIAATTCWFRMVAANLDPCANMNTEAPSINAAKLSVYKPSDREIKNFWKKVDKNGPIPDQTIKAYEGLRECWEWVGAINSGGYGNFWFNRRIAQAHRAAFLIQNGFIDDELEVLHVCDNRKCMRHLIQGTTKDNIRDAVWKGRHVAPKGEKCNLSRLTEDQVIEIRAKYAAKQATQVQLAAEYGIVQSGISSILRRENWKHVT